MRSETELHIRVDKELKTKLYEEAKKRGLSLNAYARMLILKVIELENKNEE